MRVIFAGTPEFARVALAAVHAAGFDIPLVLTQPDRPAGRGIAPGAGRDLDEIHRSKRYSGLAGRQVTLSLECGITPSSTGQRNHPPFARGQPVQAIVAKLRAMQRRDESPVGGKHALHLVEPSFGEREPNAGVPENL